MTIAWQKLINQLPVWILFFPAAAILWYYAFTGLARSNLNLHLKHGGKHLIQGKKAIVFGFLFLLGAAGLTWMIVIVLMQEIVSFY